MVKWCLLLLVAVVGCGELELLVDQPVDPEMASFVNEAVRNSGTELKSMRDNDPAVFAWDDVPLDELPDHERAAKELQRAKWFSVEVVVEGEVWNVSWRRYGDEWCLNNVSTALINPNTEILFSTASLGDLSRIKSHPVFRHFIPRQQDRAKRALDAIRKRMKQRPDAG